MKNKRNKLSNDFLYCCKLIREDAGYTQAQVADEVGCTPQNISLFENGYNDSAVILKWYMIRDNSGVLRIYG